MLNFKDITDTGGSINQFAMMLRRLHDSQDAIHKSHKKNLPKFRTSKEIEAMFMREFKRYSGEHDYNYKHWIGTILYDWDHEEYKDFYTKDNLLTSIERWESSQTTINDIEKAFIESGLINEEESIDLFNKLKRCGVINPDNTINKENLFNISNVADFLNKLPKEKHNHMLKILNRSSNTDPIEYNYLKRKISEMNESEFKIYTQKINDNDILSNTGRKTKHLERKGINEVIALAPTKDKQLLALSLSSIQGVEELIKGKPDDTFIAIASRVLGKNNLVKVSELKSFINLLKKYKHDKTTTYESFIEEYKTINPRIILHTIIETVLTLSPESDRENYLSFMFGNKSKNPEKPSYLFDITFLKSLLDQDQETTESMKPTILQNLYLDIQKSHVFIIHRPEVTSLLEKLNNIEKDLSLKQQCILSSAIYHSRALSIIFGDAIYDAHQKRTDFTFSRLKFGLKDNCPKSLVMLMSLLSHNDIFSSLYFTEQLLHKMNQTFKLLVQMNAKYLTDKPEWGPHLNHLIMGYNNTKPGLRESPSLSDIATIYLTLTIISSSTLDTINTDEALKNFLLNLANKAIKILRHPDQIILNGVQVDKVNPEHDALNFIHSLLTMKDSEVFKNELCDMIFMSLSTEIVNICKTKYNEHSEIVLVILDVLCTNLYNKQWEKDEDKINFYADIIDDLIDLCNTCQDDSADLKTTILKGTLNKTFLNLLKSLKDSDIIEKIENKIRSKNGTAISFEIDVSSDPLKDSFEMLSLDIKLSNVIEKLEIPAITFETIREFLLEEFRNETSEYWRFLNPRKKTLFYEIFQRTNYTSSILYGNEPRNYKKLFEIFKLFAELDKEKLSNHPLFDLFSDSQQRALFTIQDQKSSQVSKTSTNNPLTSQGAMPALPGQGMQIGTSRVMLQHPSSAGTAAQPPVGPSSSAGTAPQPPVVFPPSSAGAAAQPQPSSSTTPSGIAQIIKDHLPTATSSSEEIIIILNPINDQLNALKYITNIKELHLPDSALSQNKKEIANIALNNPEIAIFIGTDKLNLGDIMPAMHFIYKTDAKSIADCNTDPSANSITYDCRDKETKIGSERPTALFLMQLPINFLVD